MRKVSEILRGCGLFADSEEALALYVDEVLTGSGRFTYLDSSSSVSALADAEDNRVWDDHLLDQQCRRLLHGS